MSYSTAKLQTAAECNRAIEMANERKSDFVFDQTVSDRQLTEQGKATALTNANLIRVKAEITGVEAAIAATPDGQAKDDLKSKLRRLNDRKDNLEERLQKGGAAALLDTELDAELLKVQIAAVEAYVAAVQTRKTAIG